ncbi:MAG: transposase [Cyanobacteria bacterium P01_F01_bin.53]
MTYSSSLTDAEWEILEPLLPSVLPPKKETKPLSWSYRELIDGMLYRLKNGCNWEDLPKDFPPWLGARSLAARSDAGSHRYSTVFWHYNE